jgi:transposase-like protein
MMYIRFPLSLRNVEDLLFERGIDICHETVRFWSNGFGPMITSEVRRQRVSHMRGFRHWRWHLDEMYVKLNGEMIYLWRAVDHEGEVLESYVTKSRDKEAALRFMKKTLKRYGSPERITTDGLGSYKAAMRELGNAPKQDIGRHANNRVKTVTCRFDDESEQCSAFGGWRHCRNSRPPVTPPTRKGFGTTIVNRSVPYDLGGKATIDYAVHGVRAEFCIPARHVSEPKSFGGPEIRVARPNVSSQQPIDMAHFGRKTVLLVEDSLIIALDAEDILERFGASVLTASTPEAAHGILDQQRVDYAILDINLGDQTSFGVADRLKELGTPYFFASGYGEQANLPMDYRSTTVVQKPYTTHNIARGIDEIFP